LENHSFLYTALYVLPPIYALICIGSTLSFFEYFFQRIAESKGLTHTSYGFVFSASKVAMLVGSLTAEFAMNRFSLKFVFLTGLLGSILTDIGMGSLYWCNDSTWFLVSAFANQMIRMFMGAWFFVPLLAAT